MLQQHNHVHQNKSNTIYFPSSHNKIKKVVGSINLCWRFKQARILPSSEIHRNVQMQWGIFFSLPYFFHLTVFFFLLSTIIL